MFCYPTNWWIYFYWLCFIYKQRYYFFNNIVKFLRRHCFFYIISLRFFFLVNCCLEDFRIVMFFFQSNIFSLHIGWFRFSSIFTIYKSHVMPRNFFSIVTVLWIYIVCIWVNIFCVVLLWNDKITLNVRTVRVKTLIIICFGLITLKAILGNNR